MHNTVELDSATALEEVARLDTRKWIDTAIVKSQYGAAGNDATCEDPTMTRHDIEAWARHASVANGFGDAAAVRPETDRFGDEATSARPASYELYRAARAHRAVVLRGMIAAAIAAVGAIARRAYAAYRPRRLADATYEALNELDDRALRDLGLNRTDLESVTRRTGTTEISRVRMMWALQ